MQGTNAPDYFGFFVSDKETKGFMTLTKGVVRDQRRVLSRRRSSSQAQVGAAQSRFERYPSLLLTYGAVG
jgi:hypothetical protein